MKKECAKTSFQRQVFSFLQRNISSRTKTIWIGFSAGLDSSVLIYLLSLYLQQQGKNSTISLKAIHINHGLQDGSTLWENQCQLVCDTLNIPLIVKRFSHIVSHGKGLEQAARAARFSAFDHYLEENDVLCLAHHLQDQAETFLYRLIRGSGIHGLAAMQAVQRRQSYYILKPLLDSPHEQLKLFAREHNIQWLDDPSNQQQKFDRNFLRQTILAGLRKRWSDIDLRIYKTTALCREQASLLNELAILDSNNQHCTKKKKIKIEGRYLSFTCFPSQKHTQTKVHTHKGIHGKNGKHAKNGKHEKNGIHNHRQSHTVKK